MHLGVLMKLPLEREDSKTSWIPTHQFGCRVVSLKTSIGIMIKTLSDRVKSSKVGCVRGLIC